MSEMPERIWAKNWVQGFRGKIGTWAEHNDEGDRVEFVRALPAIPAEDVRAGALKEAAAACAVLAEAGVSHYGPEPYRICEAHILALIPGAKP